VAIAIVVSEGAAYLSRQKNLKEVSYPAGNLEAAIQA